MGALAVPAATLKIGDSGDFPLPKDTPLRRRSTRSSRRSPAPRRPPSWSSRTRSDQDPEALGRRALAITGGRGQVRGRAQGRHAKVSVPMPDRGLDYADATVKQLREKLPSTCS